MSCASSALTPYDGLVPCRRLPSADCRLRCTSLRCRVARGGKKLIGIAGGWRSSSGLVARGVSFYCGERRPRGREIRWLFDGRKRIEASILVRFQAPAAWYFLVILVLPLAWTTGMIINDLLTAPRAGPRQTAKGNARRRLHAASIAVPCGEN